MKARALVLASLFATAALVGGCDRPSLEECQRAVANIEEVTGNTNKPGGPDPKAAIRKCQGRSTKESVKCWINAKTEDDLDKCEKSKSDE